MKIYRFIEATESGGAEVLPIGVTMLRTVNCIVGAGITLLMVNDYGGMGMLATLPFWGIDYIAVKNAKRYAYNELLAFYADIKEPIFEWQKGENDDEVWHRAEAHRALLRESKNSLFNTGKIEVVEMYWKDPQYDYCETFEEFETRRSDIKRDYLREWSKSISQNDPMWRKQHLHRQKINVKEAQAA